MYMEIKALLTCIGIIFIGIALSQIILVNTLLAFLLIMAVCLCIFGDIIIGYQITKNRLKPQMDPTPRGKETCILFTLTGGFDVINTVKKPHGKREFMYNGEQASVINNGDNQIRLPCGNTAFIAHESCDENINMAEVKYAEIISDELDTNNLKDMYAKIDNLGGTSLD